MTDSYITSDGVSLHETSSRIDRVEPVELMRSHVTDLIPNARLDVIPDAGHLLPLERPDALAERIETFRKDLPTWH
ncbi:alpha/beta fold hydrolase [Nocardia alni]|uniref:alpha/beta fold hydrolase n=1 Tax=Nocardia alni TaxID=2815723 RepID=UPI001C2432EB|nr:alpha/beta hydrolase [Nocardia alni]